jgi:hypothetical protein
MQYETENEQKQCREIVNEAAALANHIRESTAEYDFEFDFSLFEEPKQMEVNLEDLKNYKIVDSSTGALIRSSAIPRAEKDGRVGEVLFVVWPAFVRRARKSAEMIRLVKSTIVVRFDHPIARGGKK